MQELLSAQAIDTFFGIPQVQVMASWHSRRFLFICTHNKVANEVLIVLHATEVCLDGKTHAHHDFSSFSMPCLPGCRGQ
jgi:hypothetical protein